MANASHRDPNPEQLPLELPARPALGRADFLVSAANEAAVALIDRWPDWPGPVVALTGPPGSGKTHLAQVWRQRSGAALAALPALTVNNVADWAHGGPRVIDTAGEDGPIDEQALFHLLNFAAQDGGFFLLTTREAPARWTVAMPDLASRLAALPTVRIGAPDDTLLAAVIVKQCADRGLKLTPRHLGHAVGRMERSLSAAGRFVAALDRLQLQRKGPVTRPLIDRALAAATA
jgi:chromosomal replication initiation ATPase DnaA